MRQRGERGTAAQRTVERCHLGHGRVNISRVGIGHRLNDDRGVAPHDDIADGDTDRMASCKGAVKELLHRVELVVACSRRYLCLDTV